MKLNLLKSLLVYTQEDVWDLISSYSNQKYNIYTKLGKFVFFQHKDEEALKPLMVAHIDTINDMYDDYVPLEDMEVVGDTLKLIETSKAHCLGGDDRVGVYCLLDMMDRNMKCDFLFTCYEEVGGEGAKEFSTYKDFNNWSCLIEIDRAGTNHLATYGYENKELEDMFNLPIQYGTYTDICDIAKTSGIAGYNIACGYYRQHTPNEYIKLSEVDWVLNLLSEELIEKLSTKQFKHNYKPLYYGWDMGEEKEDEEEDEGVGSYIYNNYEKCDYCGTYTYTNQYGFCKTCMEEDWK